VKKVAIGLRSTYGCGGTSTRQHNEPYGNQDVWHLHVHVFPRYKDDELYANQHNNRFTESKERQHYAEKLRLFLATK
jgi:histidine triad (HIT) family protein